MNLKTNISFLLIYLLIFDSVLSVRLAYGENIEKIEREAEKPESKVLLSSVTLLGIGMLTPMFVTQCPSAMSVWTAGASAALYVASETGLIAKMKDGSQKELEAFVGRGDEEKQVQSLMKASTLTNNAAKAADKKSKFAKIAGMGFTLAALLAALENMKSLGMPDCKSQKEGMVDRDSSTHMNPNGSRHTNDMIQHQNADGSITEVNSSTHTTANGNYSSTFSRKTIQPKTGLSLGDKLDAAQPVGVVSGAAIGGLMNGSSILSMGALGLGAASSMLLMKQAATQGKLLNKVITTPTGRAVVFGGFAALTNLAAADIDKVAQAYREEAKKYEELALELSSKTQMRQSFDLTSVDGVELSCFTGGPNQLQIDPTCECKKEVNCKISEVPRMTSFENMNSSMGQLNETLKDLEVLSNSLYQGDLEGASLQADRLSQKTEQIERAKESLLKQINTRRVKQNLPPVSFSNQEGAFNKRVLSAFGDNVLEEMPENEKEAFLGQTGKNLVFAKKTPRRFGSRRRQDNTQEFDFELPRVEQGSTEPPVETSFLEGSQRLTDEEQDFTHIKEDLSKRHENIFDRVQSRYQNIFYNK